MNTIALPETAAGLPVPSTPLFAGLFSSATDEWPTPRAFFDQMAAEFGPLDLDVCATPQNAKCARFFTRADDGLAQPWAPARCWMNPPYGRTIGAWMAKARQEAQRGALVVCLVPARTDTAWWHDYAAKWQVRFLRGRLRFEGGKHSAPFPSAVVVFHPANSSGESPADSQMTNDKPKDDSGAPVCSKALLGSSVPASATNPSLCDRETLATFFDSEETKYEVKAEACREPPRDMVTQAMHAGFAAGMRFAAATVRCKPNAGGESPRRGEASPR